MKSNKFLSAFDALKVEGNVIALQLDLPQVGKVEDFRRHRADQVVAFEDDAFNVVGSRCARDAVVLASTGAGILPIVIVVPVRSIQFRVEDLEDFLLIIHTALDAAIVLSRIEVIARLAGVIFAGLSTQLVEGSRRTHDTIATVTSCEAHGADLGRNGSSHHVPSKVDGKLGELSQRGRDGTSQLVLTEVDLKLMRLVLAKEEIGWDVTGKVVLHRDERKGRLEREIFNGGKGV